MRCGGGFNHRFGLDDAILIKDNHIAVAGGVRAVLERARADAGHLVKIEIEVDTLAQLREVLDTGLADVVLLDNMEPADDERGGRSSRRAAWCWRPRAASRFASAAGSRRPASTTSPPARMTHSAPNFDVGLDIEIVDSSLRGVRTPGRQGMLGHGACGRSIACGFAGMTQDSVFGRRFGGRRVSPQLGASLPSPQLRGR